MKKMLFTAVSALAMSAAIAADSTQFGVLKVPSSATNTIVSVPWLASGTGSDDVKVADLVLTAGLKTGDQLRLYNNAAMTDSWRLEKGTWVPSNNVGGNNDVSQSGSDQTGITRGKALMLVRTEPDNPAYFYIMGKPADSEAGNTTMASGSDASPAYTLIAPSRTQATNVGALMFTGVTPFKDYLIYYTDDNSLVSLTYVSAQNGWYNPKTKKYNDLDIPAGQGIWFMSRSSGTKTVSWGN